MIISSRPAKGYYSETEAARELGLSLDSLRALVRKYILECEEDAHNLSVTSYQPSDLLLLRMILAQGQQDETLANQEG